MPPNAYAVGPLLKVLPFGKARDGHQEAAAAAGNTGHGPEKHKH